MMEGMFDGLPVFIGICVVAALLIGVGLGWLLFALLT